MTMRSATRAGTIKTGAILLGLGLLVTLGSMAAGGRTYILAWGPLLFGIVRLIQGLTMPPDVATTYREEDNATEGAIQIAGRPCAACRKKILSEVDGTRCGRCDKPVHDGCLAEHRREHRKAGAGPTATAG
jgi:hypothetical protein